MEGYDTSKISHRIIKVVQALAFLLSLDENRKMDRVKLIKLLWAADRYHLRAHGRMVSGTDYVAMVHGPVSSLALDVAQISKEFALSGEAASYVEYYFTATSQQTAMSLSPGDDHLSETDKDALGWAWDTFGNNKTFDLADSISHAYPEWSQYSRYFAATGSGARPIDTEKFFENPETDKYFHVDAARLSAAKAIFLDTVASENELSICLRL